MLHYGQQKYQPNQLMLENLGNLYTLGINPDWNVLAPKADFIQLPSYIWEHDTHWQESESSKEDISHDHKVNIAVSYKISDHGIIMV